MDNDYNSNRLSDEFARQRADEKNCTIEYSDDYTLQLDIDSETAYDTFHEQLHLLEDLELLVTERSFEERRSRNGNRHVIIKLRDPLPITEHILLQACLGSDLKRELLAYAGVLKGQKNPVLLFRPKEGL